MKRILLIVIALLLVSLIIFFVLRVVVKPNTTNRAVLKVNAIPEVTIFLDNQHIGKTPYEDYVTPGEYTLKLVPQTTVERVASWEGKIKLTSGLLTYINRDLGESELKSAGETLTLEKIAQRSASVAIVSMPDGATITVDGVEKGATPLVLDTIEPGEHEITATSLGSVSRTIKIKATVGYKLTISFQLALANTPPVQPTPAATESAKLKASPTPKASASPKASATPSATPKAAAIPKPYVEILDTPTGFLRVREKPSTAATESARVNPGQTFPFISEQSSWFEIEYATDKQGWVSSQYAKKVE